MIKTFQDLTTWQEAHKLVLRIYVLSKTFPREEMFGLTSQIRRCAVSITSNIAEGFSRQTFKEKNWFYFVSKGSLSELQNQLIIARDVGYIIGCDFEDLFELTSNIQRLIHGLIKSSTSYVQKPHPIY